MALPKTDSSTYLTSGNFIISIIKQIRWEHDRCESTVVANMDTSRFEPNKTQWFQLPSAFPKADAKLCPTKEWETVFLKYFDSIRNLTKREFIADECEKPSSIPKPPKLKNKKGWKLFCFGNKDSISQDPNPSDGTHSVEKPSPIEGTPPTLALLKKLDSVSTFLSTHKCRLPCINC
jgi:hypothetical protein